MFPALCRTFPDGLKVSYKTLLNKVAECGLAPLERR